MFGWAASCKYSKGKNANRGAVCYSIIGCYTSSYRLHFGEDHPQDAIACDPEMKRTDFPLKRGMILVLSGCLTHLKVQTSSAWSPSLRPLGTDKTNKDGQTIFDCCHSKEGNSETQFGRERQMEMIAGCRFILAIRIGINGNGEEINNG
ncbi:unnamed protein product [Larinioides sclopetarius]|uniref:Uncharacterized protein n=1 Tax=Larinioides sclopetarius TaxID=280406 RepID=A0AAV2A1M9_9ARAC